MQMQFLQSLQIRNSSDGLAKLPCYFCGIIIKNGPPSYRDIIGSQLYVFKHEPDKAVSI